MDYPIFDGDEKIKSIHVDLFVDNLNQIRLTNQKYFDLFVDLQNSLKISGTVKNIGVQIARQRDNAQPIKEQNKEPFKLEDLVLPYIDVAINDGYISFDGKTIDYQNIKLFANEKYFSIDGNLSDNYLMLRRDNKDIFTKIESKNSSILNKFIGSQLLDGKSITLTAIGDQTNQKVNAQIFDLSFIDEESNQSIYTINNGKIFATIDLNTTQVNLYSIEIDGDLADLSGHVVLNHLQNSIDGDVKAYLLTSYSDFISKIPLINYIFLGEDLKVDYGAKISGKLSKPKIETSILKESVFVPINIIARVLYLPIKGIETLSSSKSSTKLKQE
ncbi:MAG: AsmA-like C-terminal domain-containing protein [Campylobacterales bacterium]|nr:AsmA-like C-terminal domain-containing protein [Campylobacterales bacterium]